DARDVVVADGGGAAAVDAHAPVPLDRLGAARVGERATDREAAHSDVLRATDQHERVRQRGRGRELDSSRERLRRCELEAGRAGTAVPVANLPASGRWAQVPCPGDPSDGRLVAETVVLVLRESRVQVEGPDGRALSVLRQPKCGIWSSQHT